MGTRQRPRRAVSVIATAGLVAGCSVSGAARAAAPSSPPTSSIVHAPPVEAPKLDVLPFRKEPCSALTKQQLAPFDIDRPPRVTSDATADNSPACFWGDKGLTHGIGFNTLLPPDGLGTIYTNQQHGLGTAFFQPTTVGSYPAVYTGFTNPPFGSCSVITGVGNNELFVVGYDVTERSSPDYQKPCVAASRVAQVVLQNLKPAT